MNLVDVKKKCSNDVTCAQFYKSGTSKKYFKCDTKSTVKSSRIGSVLYTKGILPV